MKTANSAIAGGLTSANGYYVTADATYVEIAHVEFNNGGGEGGGGGGDSVAHITMSSSDTDWSGYAVVFEDYHRRNADDTVNWNCATDESWKYAGVSVNYGDTGWFNEEENGELTGVDTRDVNYNADDTPDTVDVTFSFNWSYRPVGDDPIVTINGTQYHVYDYVDFDDRDEWLDAFAFVYHDQSVKFTVTDVPANIDGEGVSNLNIVLDLRPITAEECYIGNFLWGGTDESSDMYIPHAQLTLINVIYPDDLEDGATFDEDTIANESQMRKEDKTAKYLTYGIDDNSGIGEMVLPTGSIVTMKVAPEYGYQVTSFNGVDNVTGEGFGTTEDVAVFTFPITEANFHLGATVERIEDEVNTDNSEAVESGEISLGGAEDALSVGNARLNIEDVEVSAAQEEAFATAAEEYAIDGYLDISLSNIVYKGSAANVWDTPVNELENDATITLYLEEAPAGNVVEILHEKHDGTIEVIQAEYDPADNSITFDTDSFSTYALASVSTNIPVDWTDENIENAEFIGSSAVTVPTGSNVTIVSVGEITDDAIAASAYNELLKLNTAAYQAGGTWRIIKMLAMDLNATGSGEVTIFVGKDHAGKWAIVSHYNKEKDVWTRQIVQVDANGYIHPTFASFSPIMISITDQTEVTAITNSGITDTEPKPAVVASPVTGAPETYADPKMMLPIIIFVAGILAAVVFYRRRRI